MNNSDIQWKNLVTADFSDNKISKIDFAVVRNYLYTSFLVLISNLAFED